jgi:xanthine/CO dehydrogenase XdhC/CoxF family maturation factor
VVADGRSQLATRARFPEADAVFTAPAPELPSLCAVQEEDAIVLMTHSYPQDQALLDRLMGRPFRYLGLLGPRQRTKRLLEEIGRLTAPEAKQLHAPVGLKIGAHTPETIALAIVAEIQSVIREPNLEARMRGEQVKELEALA